MEAAQLAGTVVFAISGVLAVADRDMDWFGALLVGVVTALGGGTLRDLVLGAPVLWADDTTYLFAALAGAVAAIPLARELSRRSAGLVERTIRVADAAGLGLFAIVGADVALELGFSAPVAIVTGLLTGAGGGVLRDVLAGRRPLIMGGEIYATAAIAGATLYVGLVELADVEQAVAGSIGVLVVFAIRVSAIRRDWRLPRLDV